MMFRGLSKFTDAVTLDLGFKDYGHIESLVSVSISKEARRHN